MVTVRPFSGLRFDPARTTDLATVICPPYDVISPAEQQELYQRSPYNIVRLELGLEQVGDDEQHSRYTRAAETLAEWRREAVLTPEPKPSLYLHLERFSVGRERRERRDLIANVRLADWAEGQVLPHERTMALPKADRLKLLQATATQVSPVWSLYAGRSEAVGQAWRRAQERPPEQRFIDGEGREHQLWVLDDEALVSAIASDFQARKLYIADGHHRYETALHYRNQRREAAGGADADAPYEFLLMYLTEADDPGLVVLPTHRLLHGGQKVEQDALEEKLSATLRLEYFPVSPGSPSDGATTLTYEMERSSELHTMGMYGPETEFATLLSPRSEQAVQDALPAGASPALRALDVAIMHTLIIQPLLESTQPGPTISYTRDAVAACRAVQKGEAQLALFLRPTPVRQVLAVAEAGERMPEKSTYFYPKPPTGLVLYPLG